MLVSSAYPSGFEPVWPILLPVLSQFTEQAFGKQRVTISVTFSLIHANQHPIGVNALGLQTH